jgi:hypothetical protein
MRVRRGEPLVLLSARRKRRWNGWSAGCFTGVLGLCLAGVFLGYAALGSLHAPATASEAEALLPTIIYQVIMPTAAPDATPRNSNSRPLVTPTVARVANSPNTLNGVPLSRIIVLTDAARQRVREIYVQGQARGHNPRAFSKVGDSTMVYPPFLATFDAPGSYKLGAYAYLQRTIARFPGSFGRTSAAVKVGMHTWTEFDPAWVSSNQCRPNEGPLECELRLNNPSIAIIRLGANDVPEPGYFSDQLRKIVEYCLANGVIPVLGTKPDRQDGPANTINKQIAQIAASYHLPLWDYDLVAGTVPGRGLVSDKIHMRGGGTRDYTSGAAFQSGDSLEDLTALMMLDAVNQALPAVAAK